MIPKRLLVLAMALPLLFASCTTNPGWMQPAPFAHNKYQVPVPDHGATVVVSAPPGWHLDPEGSPVMVGSFVHPAHFLSPLVILTNGDPHVTQQTTQATVYSRELRAQRRSEPQRLADDRRMRAGFPPNAKVPVITRDPVTYRQLSTVNLPDGRRVWISRFHSPISGYSLQAMIPEDGFVASVFLPIGGSSVPDDLLAAITATVQSYRCERR